MASIAQSGTLNETMNNKARTDAPQTSFFSRLNSQPRLTALYAYQRSLFNLLKALLTNGSDNQAFIGAKWLVILLRISPSFLKRNVALRILSISPHYFNRTSRAEYRGMPTSQFLEAEF